MNPIEETIQYLQNLDVNNLNPNEYQELERAILKVWTRNQLQPDIQLIRNCLEQCRKNLQSISKESRKKTQSQQ